MRHIAPPRPALWSCPQRTNWRWPQGRGRDPFRRRNRAAGRQAGAGGRRVPFGRAPLRPDERPDVGRPAPRLEGRAGHRGQSAAGRTSPSPCSISPAAPATSPSAWSKPAAPARASPSATSMPTCSPSAPSARSSAASTTAVTFEQGNAEELPYPTGASIASPSPSASATCRASSARCAKPIACSSIGGRFLCLEFSSVDVPGLDALYELYSFNVIPRIGQRGRPATARPISIWSNRSASFPSRRPSPR